MYDDFRNRFPELTQAADKRHLEVWGSIGSDTAYLWFESLASALNTQMGFPEEHSKFVPVFAYFDTKFRTGNSDIKNCIEVSFIENLFWQVIPRSAAPVWILLPKTLQKLYVDFHEQPPKLG